MNANSALEIVGYNTSDKLSQGFIPQQLQNQAIKQYVEQCGHQFYLSWSEQKGNAPFVFRSLLQEYFYDGICFYSLEQLNHFPMPKQWLRKLAQKEMWIGFAREKQCFRGEAGLDGVERLFFLKSILEDTRNDLAALWGS